MTPPAGRVLHVQKVAGISGSEAHLLQLLPDLRARGWDVEFLMLHEDEPGAWEFARELRGRGVPLDDVRLRGGCRPDRVHGGRRQARPEPAARPAHPSRPRRRVRADRGRDGQDPAPPFDQARVQLVPRGAVLRPRRPRRRVARPRPHRDLAGPRALPRRGRGVRRGRVRDRPLRDPGSGRGRAVLRLWSRSCSASAG